MATKKPDLSWMDAAEETQLNGTARTLWKPATLNQALSQADSGNLELVSDLSRALLADDRIRAAMDQRVNGLEGAPITFELDDPEAEEPRRLTKSDLDDERVEVLRAVERDWYGMMTTGQRKLMAARGMLVGICPVYIRRWYQLNGRMVPQCEPWSPRWLRYVASEREWYIQTQQNYIKLSDQPMRWFLYCPFGDPYDEPWVTGYWYCTATWWLLKSYAIQDMGQFSQSHASPKWFMETLPGASIIDSAKREALKWLERIAQRAAIYIPQGFKVTPQESSSSGAHQIYPQEIDMASRYLAQAILGTDGTIEKEASYASASAAARIRQDLLEDGAEAESGFWHHGPLKLYTMVNFGEAADVPWPVRNVAPPEDTKAQAETQSVAAQAWSVLVDSGGAKLIDGRAFLEHYFPAILDDGQVTQATLSASQIAAGVQIMTQLGAGAIDSTAAASMLEGFLGISPEVAAQIVGSGELPAAAESALAELQASSLALLAESTGATNFPKRGDNRAVSLRNSEYDTFDPAYVDDLEENWPEIWPLGGSSGEQDSGDSQYKKLRPVIARGGSPEDAEEEQAIRTREAWAARHYENKRIAGVVALAKWFVVGKLGERGMKTVIEERKALVRQRRGQSKQTETWLLKEPPRDVRQHLHDGIEYVDAITGVLNERTPQLMKPPAQQILDVIERAGGYDEARQALLNLYPQLERRPLRDALTGATLLAQVAGRLTAGRENEKTFAAKSAIMNERVLLSFNQNQPRDDKGRFAPGTAVPEADAENLKIRRFSDLPKGYPDAVLKRGKEDPAKGQVHTPDGSSNDDWRASAKERLGKLSKEDAAAIKHYTSDDFQEVLMAERLTKEQFAARVIESQKLLPSKYKESGLPPSLYGKSREEVDAAYDRARRSGDRIDAIVRNAKPSPGVVYRGLNGLTEAQLQTLIDNDTITLGGITSTSRSFAVAGTNFATNVQYGSAVKNAILVMHQHSAVSVEHVSSKKKEAELVLPRGTKFRVLKRYAPNDKRLVIEMEEIAD